MSALTELFVSAADAVIAAIDAEESAFARDWANRTNGTYRNNKSRDYRDYYQKRILVLVWGKDEAIVQFAPDTPLRTIRRSHLTID